MTLVHAETGELVGPLSGTLTATGYHLPDGLTFDQWASEGAVLLSMARSCMWWVGDWIRYGERRYGEKYRRAMERAIQHGYDQATAELNKEKRAKREREAS